MGNEEILTTNEESQVILDTLETVLPPVESKMDVEVAQTKDNDWLYVLSGVAATIAIFLSGKLVYNKFFKKKPIGVVEVIRTDDIVDSEKE